MTRSLADFTPLSGAEKKLRYELDAGREIQIAAERPPHDAGPEYQIRATFLRYIWLGGCDQFRAKLPEKGLRIKGARITGLLDLEGVSLDRNLMLRWCSLDEAPVLYDASLNILNLKGSAFPGLEADRLEARGGVFFQEAHVTGTVRLVGARFGAELSCTKARIFAQNPREDALFCDRIQVGGSVFLNGARLSGSARFPAARIGGTFYGRNSEITAARDALFCVRMAVAGDTDFVDTTIRGGADLAGARLSGRLDLNGSFLSAREGRALNAAGAEIKGGLFLGASSARKLFHIRGVLDLTAAQIGRIEDHPRAWPRPRNLRLNRCTYSAFTGGGINAEDRIRWLKLILRPGQEFEPQPWEHCAAVLRDTGHADDARVVLIEKERLQRKDRRAQLRKDLRFTRARLAGLSDALLGGIVGYGHRPLRALRWMIAFWLLGIVVFQAAAVEDALQPNTPIVMRAPEWANCRPVTGPLWADHHQRAGGASPPETHRACFHRQPEGAHYPRFNRFIYSADTLVPLVSLEMQEYWMPNDGARHQIGAVASWYLVFQIAAGWALSLLAVAGFTGLIRSGA